MRSRIAPWVLAVAVVAIHAPAQPAFAQYGPQGVVRQFCQLDGMGMRATMPGWLQVAPLVAWTLEPAWDHVVVVGSYIVGAPRPVEGRTALDVDVRYDVVGEISGGGMRAEPGIETITLRVDAPGAGSWRILGPPPLPHLFADRLDVGDVRASLENGTARFVPDSLFVWQMFRKSGWQIPRLPISEVLATNWFRIVTKPAAGDLVVYLRDGRPYHVGILTPGDTVVSSTINAGIVGTPVDAFAGDVKYARLVGLPGIAAEDEETAMRKLNRRLLHLRLFGTPTPAAVENPALPPTPPARSPKSQAPTPRSSDRQPAR